MSKLTGLGIDTLRAWERRYQAITPTRDDRGRLYSEADIARLQLLHRAVIAGHSIGRIATLTTEELTRLAEAPGRAPAAARLTLDTTAFHDALTTLDTVGIDQEFSRIAAVTSPLQLVKDVMLPTLRELGDRWNRPGGIAHEHLTTAAMRHMLGSFLRLYARRDAAIRLLFATPAGERHEIGILAAAMLAASQGFAVSYVGVDVPAREIVDAVARSSAKVLVLGVTLTTTGEFLQRELQITVNELPSAVALWTGGAGVEANRDVLGARALAIPDFDAFSLHLAGLSGRGN